jgi:hypothetical protein
MRGRAARLHCLLGAEAGGQETEHLLNMLGRVVLVTAEDVRFGAFGVSKLMNMSLSTKLAQSKHHRAHQVGRTIVP